MVRRKKLGAIKITILNDGIANFLSRTKAGVGGIYQVSSLHAYIRVGFMQTRLQIQIPDLKLKLLSKQFNFADFVPKIQRRNRVIHILK